VKTADQHTLKAETEANFYKS